MSRCLDHGIVDCAECAPWLDQQATDLAALGEAQAEVARLRRALADLLRNTGCMCDHPLVNEPCAKCRATRELDA